MTNKKSLILLASSLAFPADRAETLFCVIKVLVTLRKDESTLKPNYIRQTTLSVLC